MNTKNIIIISRTQKKEKLFYYLLHKIEFRNFNSRTDTTCFLNAPHAVAYMHFNISKCHFEPVRRNEKGKRGKEKLTAATKNFKL